MKRAIVTGGTGCVGRNLINELVRDGWEVIALHRASSQISRLDGLGIQLRECDLRDADSALAAVPGNIDAIFHAAGSTSHWRLESAEQFQDNVVVTRNLVRAALARGVGRFIFTSTGATRAYAHLASHEQAARISNSYIRTKRMAEIEIARGIEQGLDAVITKPIIVIGAYDYNSYSQIFTSLRRGWPPGVFPGTINFCHARDVARGHVQAFSAGRTGESYELSGPSATWLCVFQKIAQLLGVAPRRRSTPPWMLYALAYPCEWMSYVTRKRPILSPQLIDLLGPAALTSAEDHRKSRDELGYESASLDAMLTDCHDWMVSEGRLAPRVSHPLRA